MESYKKFSKSKFEGKDYNEFKKAKSEGKTLKDVYERKAKSQALENKKKDMAGKMMPKFVGSGLSAAEHNKRALEEEKRTGRDYHTHKKLSKGHKEIFGY